MKSILRIRLATLVIALAFSFLAAACGGGGSTAVAPPPPVGPFTDLNLKGQYAFVTNGELVTANGETGFARMGSFTADGAGNITGGIEDANTLGFGTTSASITTGTYVVNPDGTLTAGPAVLQPEEYSSRLVAADPELTAALPGGAGLVVLDGTVTPELEAEGWAKDRIRELQELRKNTGLDVSDRIRVVISVPAERADWARTHADLIAGEILATSFEFGEPAQAAEIGDGVRVTISKI